MTDRVNEIISQIRYNIGELSNAVQKGELYNKINRVQSQIMLRTGCLERNFDIVLKKDVQSYDILPESVLVIDKLFTSWKSDLRYQTNWAKYKDIAGQHPFYYTIYADKIYFAPIPVNDNEIVTVWGRQIGAVNKVDDETDPEIPSVCDEAIIAGVTAMYNPDYINVYEQQIKLLNSKIHLKTALGREADPNW